MLVQEIRLNTINNGSVSQGIADIQLAAPLVYATQDRMITAHDYSVYPYSNAANVKKIRAINRTHSGHSRYSDINDPTGVFKDLDIFSDDGFIYKEDKATYEDMMVDQIKLAREKTLSFFRHIYANSLNKFSFIFNPILITILIVISFVTHFLKLKKIAIKVFKGDLCNKNSLNNFLKRKYKFDLMSAFDGKLIID